MAALSDTITPQGLLAVVPFPPSPPLRSLQAPGYALVLDGLRDPGNLGTVMRSAAALECSEIIIVACCDPLSHKAIRASMGAVFRVPWRTCQHFEDALSVLSKIGVPRGDVFAATSASDSRTMRVGEFAWPTRSAVVVGSEAHGLGPSVHRSLEAGEVRRITVPMSLSRMESLNAAAATSIIAFDICRQQKLAP
eukprot:c18582_g1_i1.p1 GENE.c18582_g1_i1~~c18582_g1_i1.p1  ORF type:complete len:194 (+),score=22.90 c18582_g1_i1:342-923(+)